MKLRQWPSVKAPGVPLEEISPGSPVLRDSYLGFAPNGPGFGLDVREEWLEPFWR